MGGFWAERSCYLGSVVTGFAMGVVMGTKFAWALLWQEFWGPGYTYSSSICGLGARALTSMGVQWLYSQ